MRPAVADVPCPCTFMNSFTLLHTDVALAMLNRVFLNQSHSQRRPATLTAATIFVAHGILMSPAFFANRQGVACALCRLERTISHGNALSKLSRCRV